MKIFIVHHTNPPGESQGYEYFTNKEEARKAVRENAKCWEMPVDYENIRETTLILGKYEVLKFLNIWASHPDNG